MGDGMRGILIATALAVSGCAANAPPAQQRLIGLTGEQVVACAGLPTRAATVSGVEYWEYQHESFATGGNCTSTLTMRDGRIAMAKVARSFQDGQSPLMGALIAANSKGADCRPIFNACGR